MTSQESKERKDLRQQKPEIIAEFEPGPNFEEEYLNFVEKVLSWPEEDEKEQ